MLARLFSVSAIRTGNDREVDRVVLEVGLDLLAVDRVDGRVDDRQAAAEAPVARGDLLAAGPNAASTRCRLKSIRS